jgi:hypothetical protein
MNEIISSMAVHLSFKKMQGRERKMTYDLLFEFREPGQFPEERTQDDPITLESGEAVVIPAVGDQVTYKYGGLPTDFKVLSRHFVYLRDRCTVNIEVGERSKHRKALALKE